MSCVSQSAGSLPPLCQWSGLEPICKIPPSQQFQQIHCPLITKHRSSKLCDLLPPGVTDSIYDFLANLPIILLFVASVPARFIYCIVYNFLLNFDQFILGIEYSIINPILDFFTAPLVYLAVGLTDGENNSAFSPPYLIGVLTDACLPGIVSGIYQAIGDIFYTIGYGIGFILGLFIDLYDIILYSICTLVTFGLTFGLCLSYDIVGIFKGAGGLKFTIYPFSFLAGLLQNYINCGCVLGSYPTAYIILCLNFGGSCPSCCPCGVGFTPPACPAIPNGTPPSPVNLSVTGQGCVSEYPHSENGSGGSGGSGSGSGSGGSGSGGNSGSGGSGSGSSGSGGNSGSGNNG
ncbi:hypothetical protein [Acidianus bottle-shaped virus]|uniref:Putative transmembrane protein ORF346 n=1 Tax=Acidianus bottle-shaped virus (isolate Italy/Pozzuoli) TaxID=654911 RepID=Y346_ABVP|nr:hypothetical protein ABV_gp45 [Acidianus bottle-shaped virus]A4ZUD1.1 RecName: Full=Putative transmembrane protein ORF346 [Acidianus bottle-shaped virus (isolate Pozzuoli)]ABP73435.1 hypothetical protein [Acidianus bottle-shaped virus]